MIIVAAGEKLFDLTRVLEALEWCNDHFSCQDAANAAINCSMVRFRPLTELVEHALADVREIQADVEAHCADACI